MTKINASGNALVYSTYLGGSGTERGYGIAVDGAGNAYVTGHTSSGTRARGPSASDFPTRRRPFSRTTLLRVLRRLCHQVQRCGQCPGVQHVSGRQRRANSASTAARIAVDSDGNAYVGGHDTLDQFPRCEHQHDPAGLIGGGQREE